jgi:hypothetical protein
LLKQTEKDEGKPFARKIFRCSGNSTMGCTPAKRGVSLQGLASAKSFTTIVGDSGWVTQSDERKNHPYNHDRRLKKQEKVNSLPPSLHCFYY